MVNKLGCATVRVTVLAPEVLGPVTKPGVEVVDDVAAVVCCWVVDVLAVVVLEVAAVVGAAVDVVGAAEDTEVVVGAAEEAGGCAEVVG